MLPRMVAFTLFHVILSLIGIGTGLVVVLQGFLRARLLSGWTKWFLATTLATNLTGFMFPVKHFMPSHAVGILSTLILGVALVAKYGKRLAGKWRATYVVTAVLALDLNVFVLIAQLFQKVPVLHAFAPTGSEPAFAIAQAASLLLFIGLGIASVIRFRPAPAL